MKAISAILLLVLCFAGASLAADIDGKWVSERKMNRDGQEFTIKNTMDLKSDGASLTGTMLVAFGEMERTMDIKEGKLDGHKFSFAVTMETPNGDLKLTYEGTVDGSSMKGTVTREGASEARPFEAKKQ